MNVTKRYWKWDEVFNTTPFKLGGDIQYLLLTSFVIKTNDPNEYSTEQECPWKIRVVDDKIRSISYQEVFFSFSGFNLEDWNLIKMEFDLKMDSLLERTDENFEGDLLCVVFRDDFVAIAGILRNAQTSE